MKWENDLRVHIEVSRYKNGIIMDDSRSGTGVGQAFRRIEQVFVQNRKGEFEEIPFYWMIAA